MWSGNQLDASDQFEETKEEIFNEDEKLFANEGDVENNVGFTAIPEASGVCFVVGHLDVIMSERNSYCLERNYFPRMILWPTEVNPIITIIKFHVVF